MKKKVIYKMNVFVILSIVGLIILGLSHFSCSVDTHKDKYGIKVTYKVPWFPPHGKHANAVAKLYYKGKLISPNLYYAEDRSYRLSPDKNLILFIEYYLNAKRYGIYVISENRIIYFHQTYYLIDLEFIGDEYHKIKWGKEKIVISYVSSECILHIDENILEKCGREVIYDELNRSFKSLYEYLLILIKQLYERIDKSDQQKYNDIFKPYIKKVPIKDYFKEISSLKLKENKHYFDDIGETFKVLVDELRSKYGKNKMYKIFVKNFSEKFELIDGKIKLKRKGLLW